MNLTIGYLYPDLMNIYGDTGNIICLVKRGEWRGIKIQVKPITIGTPLKSKDVDLYFFGGGQDESQIAVVRDLERSDKGRVLKQDVEQGVPLLSICGGYQLLASYYKPSLKGDTKARLSRSPYKPQNGPKLTGVGVFPAYTQAGEKRMIGDIVIQSSVFSPQYSDRLTTESEASLSTDYLVGFENHSGKTYLLEGGQPLGKVIKGFGNNGEDQTEGCIVNHAIGCYMHGSLLPKNSQLADWFIEKALEVKYGKEIKLKPLNDSLELKAQQAAINKFS